MSFRWGRRNMKQYPTIVAFCITLVFSLLAADSTAEIAIHTAAGADLAQCDKDIAETVKQKAGADTAALAARKEETAAKQQIAKLQAQRMKATTPEAKKEFDDAIKKAQGDADTASANAREQEGVARERILHEAKLQFERIKLAAKADEEKKAIKERQEAEKLNEKKRERADKP